MIKIQRTTLKLKYSFGGQTRRIKKSQKLFRKLKENCTNNNQVSICILP